MSSFWPDPLIWRPCASIFPPPIDRDHMRQANELLQTLSQYNNYEIEFRTRGHDIVHHVFRWDLTPYEQVFQNGFRARDQDGTANNEYFNLEHHVNHGGVPGSQSRRIPHAFVSTTLNRAYYPQVNADSTTIYRYEMFAPGGIWVAESLGDRYPYERQDEVAFVAGIAPQYIRSAQLFRAIDDPRNRRRRIWQPADDPLIVHTNFNPQVLAFQDLIIIQDPIVDHWDPIRRRRVHLEIIYEPPHAERRKREVSASTDSIHWYAEGVADIETYINAAFRSTYENHAYLFMNNEYVVINYAPGTTDDTVSGPPIPICDGFPSLEGTAFSEYGIDCAFGSNHDFNQAFIFSGNLCACIDFAPRTTDDKILRGPMTIAKMFPFLRGTVFEDGADAAFESTRDSEAYLFKGKYYALINYSSGGSHLIGAIRLISQGFPSLRGTIFASGIEAAFASHRFNEAYLFKGDSYALINFAPGTTDDCIIGGVKKILPNWSSLRSILPRKNRGVDVHDHITIPDADDGHHDHDEH